MIKIVVGFLLAILAMAAFAPIEPGFTPSMIILVVFCSGVHILSTKIESY